MGGVITRERRAGSRPLCWLWLGFPCWLWLGFPCWLWLGSLCLAHARAGGRAERGGRLLEVDGHRAAARLRCREVAERREGARRDGAHIAKAAQGQG